MRLVIDIPEEAYKTLLEEQRVPNGLDLEYLVMHGTPIPKGHGRLIDADELKTLSYEVLVDTDNPNREDGLSSANGVVEEDIDLAPTIIEADKAESEDKE